MMPANSPSDIISKAVALTSAAIRGSRKSGSKPLNKNLSTKKQLKLTPKGMQPTKRSTAKVRKGVLQRQSTTAAPGHWKPFQFPKIEAYDARLNNTLLQIASDLQLSFNDRTVTLNSIPARELRFFNPYLVMDLNIDGLSGSFAVDKKAASMLFATLSPVDNLLKLPKEILISAAEAALDPIISDCENILNKTITITSIHAGNRTSKNLGGTYFAFTENGANAGHIHFRGAKNAAEFVFNTIKQAAKQLRKKPSYGWELSPSTIRVELSELLVPITQTRKLRRGDILIIDNASAGEPLRVSVRIMPNLVADGEFNDNLITINSALEVKMQNISAQYEDQSQPAELDKLQVKVSFEVGNKLISLGELKHIQPGHTFEMNQSIETPVNIRANGKLMGHGELVQVGNRVGVRILELESGASR